MKKNKLIIITISILSVILLILFTQAALSDDIFAHYNFNEDSGTIAVEDINGIFNITNGGNWTTGLIGNGYWANGSENSNMNFNMSLLGTNFTINFWLNRTGAVTDGQEGYVLFNNGTGAGLFRFLVTNGNNANVHVNNTIFATYGLGLGAWNMFTIISNFTGAELLVNGTSLSTISTTYSTTFADVSKEFCLFSRGSDAGGCITATDAGLSGDNTKALIIDELGFWNRSLTASEVTDLYNAGAGLSVFPIVTLESPPNNTLSANITYEFIGTLRGDTDPYRVAEGNVTNGTLWVYFQNGSLFNNTVFQSLSGSSNITSLNITTFTPNIFVWNILGCSVNATADSICEFASSNFTLTFGAINTSFTFNNLTAETNTETFLQDITIPSSVTISSVEITWNGTARTGTSTLNSGTNYTLSHTFDIPLVGESIQNFNWNVTFSNGFEQKLEIHNQTVNAINFTLCEASPQNVPYINFTFKNETTNQETVNASVNPSTFTYWLGGGALNKSLPFSNSDEIQSYGFCFSPAERILNVDTDFRYINAESQQRIFNPNTLVLTNITSNQTLFLLPTSLSLFSPFNVVTPVGSAILGVRASVTRTLGGTVVDITSAITDASGFVGFFLDPDATYNIVFSKVGLVDVIVSAYNPKSATTTVVMGLSGGIVSNGTGILTNTTLEITPLNNSLPNNTVITFGFNVTSSLDITLISMNITNRTGGQIGFISNAGQGFITLTADTANLTQIVGRYIVQTSGETISISKVWTVGQDFIGDYSLFRQLRLFNEYGFSDFIRILLVLLFISGVLIFLSTSEILDTSESKIAVALLLIWAFSIVSWLDTGLIVNSTTTGVNNLAQFSNQFGIAILSTGASVFFIFRRIFT